MSITAPSGKVFNPDEISLITALGNIGFIRYNAQPYMLKSKVESHVYVYGREELTANPHVLWSIGREICYLIRDVMDSERDGRRACLIGLPTAGTPLAEAAALVDFNEHITRRDTLFYQMRSVLKGDHGVHNTWLVGKVDTKKHRVFRSDNVVTDGGTKFEMAERLVQDGLPWDLDEIILVDRQQGALENMRKRGFSKVHVLWNLLDLTYVFGKTGLWPEEAVAQVEQEIKEHQLLVA